MDLQWILHVVSMLMYLLSIHNILIRKTTKCVKKFNKKFRHIAAGIHPTYFAASFSENPL
jgi:hypothetical protein